jgi:hypothetical protein
MVRKGNANNIQAIDDVCGVRAVAGLGTVEEAIFRSLSDKCVAGGKSPGGGTYAFPYQGYRKERGSSLID